MNKSEYLLTCIIEECSEIQKAISKTLRFGAEDGYPGKRTTNTEDIINEINDLFGAIHLAQDLKILPEELVDTTKIIKKKEKITKYMEYSKKCGTLTD